MGRPLAILAVLALGASSAQPAAADQKSRCIAASEQGQQLRDSGKYTAARDALAQCARDACPALVRRDCTRWQADLLQLWPSVVFGAKDVSGNDQTAVTVKVDGAVVTTTLDGKPFQLDPGEHVFRFESASAPPAEKSVLIRAGEKSRLVSVQLGSPPKATKSDGPGAGTSTTPQDPGVPTGAWVFGGLAVTAFALEAYFGVSGLVDRSALQSQPCAKTATCDVSSVRTKFTAADIALGVGVVSAALSIYLFLSHGAEKLDSPVDVSPVRGGATATWATRF